MKSMVGCISTGEDAGGCQRVSLDKDTHSSVLPEYTCPHFRLRQISLSKTVFGQGLGMRYFNNGNMSLSA